MNKMCWYSIGKVLETYREIQLVPERKKQSHFFFPRYDWPGFYFRTRRLFSQWEFLSLSSGQRCMQKHVTLTSLQRLSGSALEVHPRCSGPRSYEPCFVRTLELFCLKSAISEPLNNDFTDGHKTNFLRINKILIIFRSI